MLGSAMAWVYDLHPMDAPIHTLAVRYIWWKTPEEASRSPRRVMAQVMNLGTYPDVRTLEKTVGAEKLAEVLRLAEPGWFSPRSWHFWHRRLRIVRSGPVPALPARQLA